MIKFQVLFGKAFHRMFALIFTILFFQNNISAQCTQIGPYYWGGKLNGVSTDSTIYKAHQLAKSLYSSVIRITLNPSKYCNGDSAHANLVSLVSCPDVNAIITDPQFETVIITCYDSASWGWSGTKNYLQPSFYTANNIALIAKEYEDLANYLKQFDKKFIITHWEGDNDVYCGASYGATPVSCPGYATYIDGLQKWLSTRASGIRAANTNNVKVGIEFCIVHYLEDNNLPSVLNDIIPITDADYYLYSAYESINFGAAQTAIDIDYIRSKLNTFGKDTNALIIGEMGYDNYNWGGDSGAAVKLQQVVEVVKQKQIPYAIAWVLIDGPPTTFGLFDSDGIITPPGLVIRNSVNHFAAISEPLQIHGGYSLTPCPGEQNGQLLVVTKYGSGNYSYSWSNGSTGTSFQNGSDTGNYINGIAAGNYLVRVTDISNGCTATANWLLDETDFNWSVVINKTDPSTIGGNDGSATATVNCLDCLGSMITHTYSWSNGATTQSISNLTEGVYTATVTLAQTYCTQTDTVTLTDVPTSIMVIGSDTKNKLKVFPNPSSDQVTITLNNDHASATVLRLYNSLGQLVFQKAYVSIHTLTEKIDLESFSKGVYSVTVSTDTGDHRKSFIIE